MQAVGKNMATSILCLSLLLSACSFEGVSSSGGLGDEEDQATKSQRTSKVEPSSKDTPSPTATTLHAATLTTTPEAKTLDAWYISKLREVEIYDSKQSLLRLRRNTCNDLKSEKPLDEIVAHLTTLGYTEKQAGVIMATAMSSSCRDVSLHVDTKLLETPKETPTQ